MYKSVGGKMRHYLVLCILLVAILFFGCIGPTTIQCGNIIMKDTILTSNLNCNGIGIIIGANAITLDCQGNSITGSKDNIEDGIYLKDKTGVTIKNCAIANFNNGIHLIGSSNNSIIKNNLSSNLYSGIYSYSSNNNKISGNVVNLNEYFGIHIGSSSNNDLTENIVNSNKYTGIHIEGMDSFPSSNNRIINNIANSNNFGIYLFESSSNTLTNNTANLNKENGIILEDSFSNSFIKNRACSNVKEDIRIWKGVVHTGLENTGTENKCSSSTGDIQCNIPC